MHYRVFNEEIHYLPLNNSYLHNLPSLFKTSELHAITVSLPINCLPLEVCKDKFTLFFPFFFLCSSPPSLFSSRTAQLPLSKSLPFISIDLNVASIPLCVCTLPRPNLTAGPLGPHAAAGPLHLCAPRHRENERPLAVQLRGHYPSSVTVKCGCKSSCARGNAAQSTRKWQFRNVSVSSCYAMTSALQECVCTQKRPNRWI